MPEDSAEARHSGSPEPRFERDTVAKHLVAVRPPRCSPRRRGPDLVLPLQNYVKGRPPYDSRTAQGGRGLPESWPSDLMRDACGQ